METILTLLLVASVGTLPILLLRLIGKRKGSKSIVGVFTNIFPGGPRYRDGAISYNQDRWGVRSNVEVKNPYTSHNSRYQRRHSMKQHKQTKPWMK